MITNALHIRTAINVKGSGWPASDSHRNVLSFASSSKIFITDLSPVSSVSPGISCLRELRNHWYVERNKSNLAILACHFRLRRRSRGKKNEYKRICRRTHIDIRKQDPTANYRLPMHIFAF